MISRRTADQFELLDNYLMAIPRQVDGLAGSTPFLWNLTSHPMPGEACRQGHCQHELRGAQVGELARQLQT